MAPGYYKKIDPYILSSLKVQSRDKISTIVYVDKKHNYKDHLHKLGIKKIHMIPLIGAACMEIPYGDLDNLAALDDVRYIAADINVKAFMNIASQEVGATIANESGYTGKGITISFIDTGIYPHRDFITPVNRIKAFVDFVNEKESLYDDNGHGSFVAGVAAGNGTESGGKYKGVAPDANIIALKAMDSEGGGRSSDILRALQWIADHYEEHQIRIVSMSLGGLPNRLSKIDPLVEGVEALWKKGITVIAAAGNSGPDPRTITTPGVSQKIITVGAADDKRTPAVEDDDIADFSSRGPAGRIVKPDIVAPGVDIISVNCDVNYISHSRVKAAIEPYTEMSGTSVATPLVAGCAALLLQKYPDWTPDQVKKVLMKHAFKLGKEPNVEGKGIINVAKCMNLM